MKNITPQSDPRQNNCRNTTFPTITPSTREWTTANCRGTLTMHIAVAVLCDWGRHTQQPRSLSRSGFSLSPRRSTLSKPPLRFGDDDDLYRLTSIYLHFSVIAYSCSPVHQTSVCWPSFSTLVIPLMSGPKSLSGYGVFWTPVFVSWPPWADP